MAYLFILHGCASAAYRSKYIASQMRDNDATA